MNGHYTTEDRGLEEQTPPPGFDEFFREVNDRIVELGTRFGFREDRLELICECHDASCTERLSIASAVYQQVRADKRRHVLVVGHERSGRVVERGDGYVVVED